MPASSIHDIATLIKQRAFPTITLWNRLEGRPRTENFNRALKAEVRDALWMLSRQWQLGEFRGDDAGSPIFAKVQVATTQLKKYRADGHKVEAFDDSVPLETKVERRPIRFNQGAAEIGLDLRLLTGRQWEKLLRSIASLPSDIATKFLAQYLIHAPNPSQASDAPICAHVESWSAFAAATGRRIDGAKLYQHLAADPRHRASDGIAGLNLQQQQELDLLGLKFMKWFEQLFDQPSGGDAWNPARLEYRFACAAPEKSGEKILTAEEYYHGHLDWYNFDIDKDPAAALGAADPTPPPGRPQILLPMPISFEGMPNTRWWTFEDRRTNFGDVKPDTTDIAKLLLIEFGLIYANDWFLIPYTLPAGSIARVEGMAVTNVFGERSWIEAAGSGEDNAWQRWAMFTLNNRGTEDLAADTSLVLLPVAPKVQEGKPIEEVMLIRDEVANMVWGVEKTIALPSGETKSGSEAALETLAFHRQLNAARPAAPQPKFKAKVRYQIMSSVPEEWIPFIPVHVPRDIREIQLQRAALPRILEGAESPLEKVTPRTTLLREGLDAGEPYFVYEEEVPRAGVRVTQSFQRTRWRDGRVWVWLGVRKQTGRGEGSSGLTFDRLEDVKPAQT